ncbi:MAG TPA: hypothetical protein VND64_01965 [Pirellulales bacterium]|nr:hypothetical protein [Pirellulales bacterium]
MIALPTRRPSDRTTPYRPLGAAGQVVSLRSNKRRPSVSLRKMIAPPTRRPGDRTTPYRPLGGADQVTSLPGNQRKGQLTGPWLLQAFRSRESHAIRSN